MLNRYPLWKYVLIIAIIVPGLLYAVPNLFGEDPGIQVSGTRVFRADVDTLRQMEEALRAANIPIAGSSVDDTGVRIRFEDTSDQLRARDIVQRDLGDRYTVALTLLPAMPSWFERINAYPMYLGLDLRGGVHFLMEVDMEAAVRRAQDRYVDDLRVALRDERIRYLGIRRTEGGQVEMRFRDEDQRAQARRLIDSEYRGELNVSERDQGDDLLLVASLSDSQISDVTGFALDQNITALRNRVNELGVAEPIVQRQGDSRIVVQLPGIQDTAKAKEILGRTATLEIMLVDEEADVRAALDGDVPVGSRLFYDRENRPIVLQNRVIYSGDNIIDGAAGFDSQSGGAVVHITLDARGASINQRITGDNIGRRMAVVYIEVRTDVRIDDQGREERVRERIEEVITAPVIRSQLGKRFQIEGLPSIEEARDLSLLLRAGALAAPIDIVEERTIGPSLGRDNIAQGFRSVVIGFVLVLGFVVLYYRVFGLVANLALALNLVLIVAVMSMMQATLTLPGVAGIVLTVGMAIDANVLIFERIREELRNGNSPQASIHAGYDRALSTIVDANVTTLIAALVLFNFGTGPIKGFAVTLSIGILTSMFTSIIGTRAVINLVYGGRRVERLAI